MTEAAAKEAYAIVGELVLISSAIDRLLNQAVIVVLDLGEASMLEAVVATLDPARKVEILKERAAHVSPKAWKDGITKFCDKAEKVFRMRNIACHTPLVIEGDEWFFEPMAAAKLLKRLDILGKTVRPTHLSELQAAIKTGEAALGASQTLIANFQRYHAEAKAKRRGGGDP